MIVTSDGTRSPTRTIVNSFSPRKRILANAYPASEATTMVPAVTIAAM
jgi:hypothetical protein